jgi:hypothetical protein
LSDYIAYPSPFGLGNVVQKLTLTGVVEECYVYNPDEFTLESWQRNDNQLVEIPQMSDGSHLTVRKSSKW